MKDDTFRTENSYLLAAFLTWRRQKTTQNTVETPSQTGLVHRPPHQEKSRRLLLTIFRTTFTNQLAPVAGQFLCEKRIPLFVIDPSLTKSLIRLTTEKWFVDYQRILPRLRRLRVWDMRVVTQNTTILRSCLVHFRPLTEVQVPKVSFEIFRLIPWIIFYWKIRKLW